MPEPRLVAGNKIYGSVGQLFDALFNALCKFSSANRTDVTKLLCLLGRKGHVAVAVPRPMVLAIRWVSFYRKLESGRVIIANRFNNTIVTGFFELEYVGFPAYAPRPETMTVTVRDQREPVNLA